MDEDWCTSPKRCTYAICTDHILGPLSANAKVYVHTIKNSSPIAGHVNQDAVFIRQYKHGTSTVQRSADHGERLRSSLQKFKLLRVRASTMSRSVSRGA
ncbi:hypothetical protein HED51_22520 [Ochrobactrum grignonense]|nr:hypothetical protein [Brucella grignonensis]